MAEEAVVIRSRPLLDLSHLKSAEELASIRGIEEVALVVVPESLSAAYAAIPASKVAATVYVPGGSNARIHTGQLAVGGDGLGAESDVLIVVGLLLITSPVTGPVPKRIHVIGEVLAPRGSESALGPALAGSTGSVSYYPYKQAQDIKVLSGQVRLSSAMLANQSGQPDDILIVAGQIVVTGVPEIVGYRRVIASGQVALPTAARDVLEPALEVQGQVVWYTGDDPRVFFDDVSLGMDFFRLLDHAVSLVVFGDLTITAGGTDAMLLEKVSGIALLGDATVPPELVGAVQVLTTDAFGTIRASGGPGS